MGWRVVVQGRASREIMAKITSLGAGSSSLASV